MNQYSISYYYLATGMEGHADTQDYGTISAKSADDACMQIALKEYPNNKSSRDFLIGCLTATLIKDVPDTNKFIKSSKQDLNKNFAEEKIETTFFLKDKVKIANIIGTIKSITVYFGNGIFVGEKAKGTILYGISGSAERALQADIKLADETKFKFHLDDTVSFKDDFSCNPAYKAVKVGNVEAINTVSKQYLITGHCLWMREAKLVRFDIDTLTGE